MEDGSLCGLLTRPDIQSCKLTAFARFFPIFLDPFAPVCRICANPNLTCRSHVSTIIFCTYGSQERLNGRLVCAVNSAFLSDTLTIRGVQLLSVATPSLRLRGALKPAWRIPSGRAPQSTSEKKKAADRSAARERKPDASPYPPRCGDGPDRAMARKVAVSDDVSTGSSCVAPSIGRGDSHGTLCRYRCVVGSIECVRGGRERPDLARSEGGERTGCVGAVLQGTGLRGDTDRDRGLSAVAMAVKSDRNDAGGIAQLLRMGWYRPVHCKSQPSQDVRALLTARKQLLIKAIDVELCLRGLLRGYGLKMGVTTAPRFADRVRELTAGHPILELLG